MHMVLYWVVLKFIDCSVSFLSFLLSIGECQKILYNDNFHRLTLNSLCNFADLVKKIFIAYYRARILTFFKKVGVRRRIFIIIYFRSAIFLV